METQKSTAEKFGEVLKKFDTAMLTTVTGTGEMHTRPMAIAEIESTGDVIFFTDKNSAKIQELQQDSHVAVSCQNGWKDSLSFSGKAEIFHDIETAKRIWRKTYQTWFPEGPDDPNLMMIRIRSERGEYWDNSGVEGVKYILKAIKAVATGKRPSPDSVDEHGTVDFGRRV